MAIQKVKKVGEGYAATYLPVGEPEHVGMVLSTFSRDRRVMSDVYSFEYFALVWGGNGTFEVSLGIAEFSHEADATVDATPEVLAAYKAWQAAQAEAARLAAQARAEREAAERAAAEAKNPTKGRRVRVVRGRNVPIGTEGVVIWRGSNDYGERVGIATTDRRDANGKNLDVVWTAVSNVEALPEGNSAAEVEDRLHADKQAWRKSKEVAQVSAAAASKAKWDAIFAAVADAKVPF